MAEVRAVSRDARHPNPELFRHTGSMEGLPEWVDPVHLPGSSAWQRTAQEWFDHAASVMPGIVIAGLLALAGRELADLIGTDVLGVGGTPVSPILVAILLGLLIRNAIGLPESYQPGLRLCLQRVLRIGVALLGLRLSLATVGSIGLTALPIVTASILTALVGVSLINRLLGLPARLGTLVAVGTAICGNSAIVATAPAIGAREDEVSYAVGCVTLFGLLALGVHPFLSHVLFDGDPMRAGLFLGTAIHDTAQVAGAGLLYRQQFGAAEALDAAMVTKLLRNVFMILVIPGMAFLYHRRSDADTASGRPSLRQAVPFFVFGFLALALLRTLGDLGSEPFGGLLGDAVWTRGVELGIAASAWCLTLAMAAVGLGTDLTRLRTLGLRPLAVGFAAALTVGVVSATLIRALTSATPIG
ncbi:MAG: putative sulfate exporter family transporter [Deltaproteobacteria bacterium]|nr:putative sulfate exporter family transporter [Deltaproteobacteria bacterium]